jgi:acyl carrier protein
MKEDREVISERVLAAVAPVAGTDSGDLRPETELVNDLNLDSLAMFELVIELEESYDLRISDEDIDRIRTIEDIIDYIVRQAG